MVCSDAMKKKTKTKKRAKRDNWDLLKRSQYLLYNYFTYFCYKKVTASSKTIFASQSSNCLTKPTRYFSTPNTTIFDFLRLALGAQNLEVHSGRRHPQTCRHRPTHFRFDHATACNKIKLGIAGVS